MKKRKLFLLCTLITLSISTAFSKNKTPELPIDSNTNKISFTEIVIVDSLSNKQELFSIAREWFAKTYNSAISVIQMEDKESGKIVGKAKMQIYRKGTLGNMEYGHVNYTITINVKDGRYKYLISDFHHTGQHNVTLGKIRSFGACEDMIDYKSTINDTIGTKNFVSSMLQQLVDNSTNLEQSLKLAMAAKSKNLENENW